MSNKFFHFHRGDKIVFLLFLALFASGILLFFFSPPGKADTSDTTKEWSTRPKKQAIQPNKEERRGGHGRDTIETDEHYVGPPQPLTYTPKKNNPQGRCFGSQQGRFGYSHANTRHRTCLCPSHRNV